VTTDKNNTERESRYCGGKLRGHRDGTCTRPAGWGTPHPGFGRCKLHGGSTESHVVAARRQQAAQLVRMLLHNPDAQPVTDPVGAMQQLAGVLTHALDHIGDRLNAGWDASSDRGRVEMAAWGQVSRELRQLLADMKRLGIADQLVELEAAQVKLTAVAAGRMLDALDLSEEQRETAIRVLLTELRSVAALEEDGAA
jgi:hypothetical protein